MTFKTLPDRKRTFEAMVRNSVGTRIFKNLYRIIESGESVDALHDGKFGCAVFVDNILILNGMLPYAKQTALVSELREFLDTSQDWKEISLEEKQDYDVIFWEKTEDPRGGANAHVGFLIDGDNAVSNNSRSGMVIQHWVRDRGTLVAAYRYIAW